MQKISSCRILHWLKLQTFLLLILGEEFFSLAVFIFTFLIFLLNFVNDSFFFFFIKNVENAPMNVLALQWCNSAWNILLTNMHALLGLVLFYVNFELKDKIMLFLLQISFLIILFHYNFEMVFFDIEIIYMLCFLFN